MFKKKAPINLDDNLLTGYNEGTKLINILNNTMYTIYTKNHEIFCVKGLLIIEL